MTNLRPTPDRKPKSWSVDLESSNAAPVGLNVPPRRLTDDELSALCAYCVTRLRLQAWEIHVCYARARDMADMDVAAQIQVHASNLVAYLKVCDVADSEPGQKPTDTECEIVHELLHIVMDAWKPKTGTHEHTALGQAINTIARTLVSQRRGDVLPTTGDGGWVGLTPLAGNG